MAFLTALRIKFVYSKVNFDSSFHTGIILQGNLGPPNNITIRKLNIVLARTCGFLLIFQKLFHHYYAYNMLEILEAT